MRGIYYTLLPLNGLGVLGFLSSYIPLSIRILSANFSFGVVERWIIVKPTLWTRYGNILRDGASNLFYYFRWIYRSISKLAKCYIIDSCSDYVFYLSYIYGNSRVIFYTMKWKLMWIHLISLFTWFYFPYITPSIIIYKFSISNSLSFIYA